MKKLLVGGVLSCLGGAAFAATVVVNEGETYEAKDAASVATLAGADSITVAAGGVIDYTDADDELVLTCPVSGEGTIKATSGKKILVLGDNSGFLGDWQIVSPVVVSNRYGLGCAASKGAFFKSGSTKDSLKFGGNGLTNDVPITLEVAVSAYFRKLDEKAGEFVQNGLVTHKAASSFHTPNATYAGGIKETGGSLTIGFLNTAEDGNASKMNGVWMRITEKPIQEGAGNLSFSGGNNAVLNALLSVPGSVANQTTIQRCHFHCGAANVVPKQGGGALNNIILGADQTWDSTQWRTSIFDLNGFDQAARNVYCGWTPAESHGEYPSEVTSPEPATLTVSPTGRKTTATKFTGAVSLVYAGTGTNTYANLLSTTTGRLTVKTGGAVGFKWNAGWQGPVTVEGGARLIVDSARAFKGGMSDIDVAEGGVIELSDGAVFEVRSLTLGGFKVPSGTYTVAGLAAEGYGRFVAGSGVIVVGAAAVTRGANPFDAMVFDLYLPETTDRAKVDDIQDAVTHAAATPVRPSVAVTYDPAKDEAGYAAFGEPAPLSVAFRENVPEWYYYQQNVTTSFNSLVFPKNVGTDANGVTAAYSTPVLWKGLPKLSGSNLSVRIRFKWAGNYKQGGQWAWDQSLFQLVDLDRNLSICNASLESIPPTEDKTSAQVRGGVGGSVNDGSNVNVHDSGASIDTWYDYVWVFENTSDSQCVIKTYWSTKSTGFVSGKSTRTGQVICPTTGNGAIVLGGQYGQFVSYGLMTGNTIWRKLMTESTSYVYSGFAGEISAFQIFDKALTLEEANAVLVGDGAGMTMRVGALNGSADEFAKAEEDVAADFNARTMQPRQLRRTLDASHPSVTITCPLRPEESGLARYLTLGVLREDVMSAPVEVRFNGVLVDTLTFEDELVKTLYVKGRYLRANADGNVVLTLTRPGSPVGLVRLDAVQLSGGWATGVLDGKRTDWCFVPYDKYVHSGHYGDIRGVVGNYRDLALSMDYMWGLKNEPPYTTWWYPEQYLTFDLPAAALGETATVTFDLGIASMGQDAEMDIWCNDMTTPIRHVGPNEGCSGKSFATVIPRENLKAGLNVIKIRDVGETFSAGQQYNNIYFDNFRLTVREPSTDGLLLIVR